MMAEINRDVLRSIILDVLQEMGGVHEAPQFKASACLLYTSLLIGNRPTIFLLPVYGVVLYIALLKVLYHL